VGDTYSKKYTVAAFGEKAGALLQNQSAFKGSHLSIMIKTSSEKGEKKNKSPKWSG